MRRFLSSILLFFILIISGCTETDNFTKSFHLIMKNKEVSAPLLTDMPAEDLRILRNTVFARHGYPFNSKELQYYFYAAGSSPMGYSFTESQDYHDALLSDIDQFNIALIQRIESGDQVEVKLPSETKEEESPIKITSEVLQNFSATQIYFILNEDVINSYPDLNKKYDTELKAKHYSETDEYAAYLKELKSLKKQLIETRLTKDISKAVNLNPYTVDKKGFYMNLPYSGYWNSSNVILYNDSPETLNQIYGFYSDDKVFEDRSSPSNISTFMVFIPCSEEVGLEIENNINAVRITLNFRIADGKQLVFTEANSSVTTYSYPLIKIEEASYQIFIKNKMVLESPIGKDI